MACRLFEKVYDEKYSGKHNLFVTRKSDVTLQSGEDLGFFTQSLCCVAPRKKLAIAGEGNFRFFSSITPPECLI